MAQKSELMSIKSPEKVPFSSLRWRLTHGLGASQQIGMAKQAHWLIIFIFQMLESMEKCQAKAAENKARRKEHRVRVKEQTEQCQQLHLRLQVQCNLDLVTLNLLTTCDLVAIFQFTT